jgi:hypothetical protein
LQDAVARGVCVCVCVCVCMCGAYCWRKHAVARGECDTLASLKEAGRHTTAPLSARGRSTFWTRRLGPIHRRSHSTSRKEMIHQQHRAPLSLQEAGRHTTAPLSAGGRSTHNCATQPHHHVRQRNSIVLFDVQQTSPKALCDRWCGKQASARPCMHGECHHSPSRPSDMCVRVKSS